ncbi:MAG TPA: hypothetical protein VFI42_07800 [Thermomicrobiaceae bacterium]|nr:hypothetical protein [Thermomicrobiaceae bacterium]
MSAARQQSLSMAVDDSYGLWELLWGLHTDFPEAPPARLRSIARQVLAGLVREGLLTLTFGPAGGAEEPLAREQALAALDQPGNWAAPGRLGDPETRFFATAAGERAYFGQTAPAER